MLCHYSCWGRGKSPTRPLFSSSYPSPFRFATPRWRQDTLTGYLAFSRINVKLKHPQVTDPCFHPIYKILLKLQSLVWLFRKTNGVVTKIILTIASCRCSVKSLLIMATAASLGIRSIHEITSSHFLQPFKFCSGMHSRSSSSTFTWSFSTGIIPFDSLIIRIYLISSIIYAFNSSNV